MQTAYLHVDPASLPACGSCQPTYLHVDPAIVVRPRHSDEAGAGYDLGVGKRDIPRVWQRSRRREGGSGGNQFVGAVHMLQAVALLQ